MTSPLGSSPSGKPEPAENSLLPLQRGQQCRTKRNNPASMKLGCTRGSSPQPSVQRWRMRLADQGARPSPRPTSASWGPPSAWRWSS